MARLLYRAERIKKPTLEYLAAYAQIPVPTLKAAVTNRSFSTELEEKLCRVVGFNPAAIEWVDDHIDSKMRQDDENPDYQGKDKAQSFQAYLETVLFDKHGSVSGEAGRPSSVDKNLLCHEVELIRSSDGKEMTLGLQADFGSRYDSSGIKYVLGQVRLDVTIGCTHGHATDRLGQEKPYRRGTATLSARGTDRQPFWDIVAAHDEAGVLVGVHEVREPPLAKLQRFRSGATIATKMRVNLHEGILQLGADIGPLSGARAAVIESIFAQDLAKDGHENGWITLSEHNLTILGGE
jgi:hypothetical protein